MRAPPEEHDCKPSPAFCAPAKPGGRVAGLNNRAAHKPVYGRDQQGKCSSRRRTFGLAAEVITPTLAPRQRWSGHRSRSSRSTPRSFMPPGIRTLGSLFTTSARLSPTRTASMTPIEHVALAAPAHEPCRWSAGAGRRRQLRRMTVLAAQLAAMTGQWRMRAFLVGLSMKETQGRASPSSMANQRRRRGCDDQP